MRGRDAAYSLEVDLLDAAKEASGGQTLRLKGKEVKRQGKAGRGDQLIRLRIVAPPKVDPELERFMTEWRKKHGYDPRRGMKL